MSQENPQSDIVKDWFEVGDSQYSKWKQYDFNWTNKTLSNVKSCIAPFGGPIALLHPDNYALMDNQNTAGGGDSVPTYNQIETYESNGSKVGSFVWDKGLIVAMGWSSEEELLILKQNAEVEAFNKQGEKLVRGYNLGSSLETEGILDAIIFQNCIVAISRVGNITAYTQLSTRPILEFIHKNIEPLPLQRDTAPKVSPRNESYRSKILGISQQQLQQQQAQQQTTQQQQKEQESMRVQQLQRQFLERYKCWTAVDYEVSDGHKVFVGLEDRINLYDGETTDTKILDGSPLQMSVSVSSQLLAILTDALQIVVVSTDLSQSLASYDIPYEGVANQMVWIGDDSILGQWDTLLHIIEPYGQQFQIEKEEFPIISQEVDGVRIITPKSCEFLQKVHRSLLDCLHHSSSHPSRSLLVAQQQYEKQDKQSINSQKIISSLRNGNQIEEAVLTLVEAASHCQGPIDQERFLKAAIFGRTFQNSINSNLIYGTVQKLRLINQVRNTPTPRIITIKQFEKMQLWNLIQRLLSQGQYPLAFKILQSLNLPTSIVMQQWAKEKIRKARQSSDIEIFNSIQDTLRGVKGVVVYASLAQYAQAIGRPQLASQLLEFEDVSQQQVQMLIDLNDYKKAIAFALQSGNPDLMFTILETIERNDNQEFRYLTEQIPILRNLYLPYMIAREQLRAQQEDDQVTFSKYVQGLLGFEKTESNIVDLAFYNIQDAFILLNMLQKLYIQSIQQGSLVDVNLVKSYLEIILKNMERARRKYVDAKNLLAASQCERFGALLKRQTHIQQQMPKKLIVGLSLHETIKACVKENQHQEEELVRAQFQVSAQHYTQIKMSALAENQEWRKYLQLLDDKRNQGVSIEMFIKVAKKYEAPGDLKIQLVEKLPNDQRKAHAYHSIGEFERAQRCAEKAKDQNLMNKLQGMMGGATSTQVGNSQFQIVSGISQALSSYIPWTSHRDQRPSR